MSILNPDQNQVMTRMTSDIDNIIRQRIREYCTGYPSDKYWPVYAGCMEITKVDKDKKGWYVETWSSIPIHIINNENAKSLYDYLLSKGCKIDKQKGFLIEDIGTYFRWRKHKGKMSAVGAPDFESTEGLPEELDLLYLDHCCKENKKFAVHSKIDVIIVCQIDTINISGNGCQNVVQHYLDGPMNITAPEGVKIHRPSNWDEYLSLFPKSTY